MDYPNGPFWTPYRSATWSRGKSQKGSQHRPSRPKLVRHSSVEHASFDQESNGWGNNSVEENYNLSILDLQTLRRDSNAFHQAPNEIRPPQQDVFRVHRPRYHISTERIWFPRPPDSFEMPEATTTTASEDTTLEDEEVEVKLPCRSVSINVVGMPSTDEVTSSRPQPFEISLPKSYSECNSTKPFEVNSMPKTIEMRPTKLNLHKHYGIQCDDKEWKQDQLSPCCRYRRPVITSLFSIGLLMVITFLVLYWNYYETVHRRLTKKQAVILDHWGKGSPSAAETAVLDIEVGILKQEEMEARMKQQELERKRNQEKQKVSKNVQISGFEDNKLSFEDVLMIDSKPNESQTTVPVLDTRVE